MDKKYNGECYVSSAWFNGVLWYMYRQNMVSCACKGACVCTCAFRQNTYPGQRLLLVERLLRLQGAVLVTVCQKGTSWGKEEKPIYDMKLGPTVIHKISLLQNLLSIALPLLFFVCSDNRPCKLQIHTLIFRTTALFPTHYLFRLLQCWSILLWYRLMWMIGKSTCTIWRNRM